MYKFRQHPDIRYASPVFCAVILVGLALSYASFYFVAGGVSTGLCVASSGSPTCPLASSSRVCSLRQDLPSEPAVQQQIAQEYPYHRSR